VFGAVSVATACLVPGSVAFELADGEVNDHGVLDVEHPTGYFSVTLERHGERWRRRGQLRRSVTHGAPLMRGDVFVPSAVWPDA